MNIWIYRGQEWYVRDHREIYVEHEAKVCEFEPVRGRRFRGRQ